MKKLLVISLFWYLVIPHLLNMVTRWSSELIMHLFMFTDLRYL